MTILDQLAEAARIRVKQDQGQISLQEMKALASRSTIGSGEAFYAKIAKPGISVICEVKKASPSKGIMDPVFDYKKIAAEYEQAGADCISCLTEPQWFLGSDEIFREIRGLVKTPMLRKDFTVEAYQLYQAKTMGADCVLLICAILEDAQLEEYLALCEELGLAALVETHDENEIHRAVSAGARMIGVNNRNLKDFTVDLQNAAELRKKIPEHCLFVSESGMKTPQDAAQMKKLGADAVLIGEAFMRSPDKTAMLAAIREAAL